MAIWPLESIPTNFENVCWLTRVWWLHFSVIFLNRLRIFVRVIQFAFQKYRLNPSCLKNKISHALTGRVFYDSTFIILLFVSRAAIIGRYLMIVIRWQFSYLNWKYYSIFCMAHLIPQQRISVLPYSIFSPSPISKSLENYNPAILVHGLSIL